MGLFDLDMSTPQGQGFNNALLAAAQALLTPRSRGGGMGAAFGAFPQAIDRAKANAMREQLMALQGKQVGLQTDKLGFDMEQAKAQQAEAMRNRENFARLVGTLPPEQRMIAEQLGPDYFKGMAPQPVKPTFQKWFENGQERSGFVAPGQAPQPVGDAKPQDMDKWLIRDESGNWVPNRALIEARSSVAKAGATKVEVGAGQKDTMWGEPPKGYVWARDPASGQVMTQPDKSGAVAPMALPIAGSKEARDREEVQAKQAQRQQYAQNVAGTILSTVREARKMVGPLSAGFGGSIMGQVPGSPAVDLKALIDPIKANIGFQRLQEMRDMSPTGGALGQVAVQELNMLQSVVSSLDQNQSPEQLRKSFDKIEKHFNNWLRVMTQADGGAPQGGSQGSNDPLGIR